MAAVLNAKRTALLILSMMAVLPACANDKDVAITSTATTQTPACTPRTVLSDGFEAETVGDDRIAPNYTSFKHWNVESGTVDVVAPGFPELMLPSKVVDLDGTTQPSQGVITTKQRYIAAPAGCRAEVEIVASGNGRRPGTDSFEVRYAGATLGGETLDYASPLTTYVFAVPRAESALTIALANPGDTLGVLIDKVEFRFVNA